MARLGARFGMVLVLFFGLLLPARAEAVAAFDSTPAYEVLERLLGQPKAAQVTLRAIDRGTGQDRFRVYADGGALVVEGTSPAVQLTGFGWYLRHVAHADVSINGSQLDLPDTLPLPSAPIARDSSVDHRFALNDTNEGYSGAYVSWAEWQHRIDVLALHGINEVLVYEGQDAVYHRMFQQFGYSSAEIRAWIPQPGHQAWWLMQNMCCTDGPISEQLIEQRIELGRKMADHLRRLGMTPVLPGYFGTVPTDFEVRNPGANTIPQGSWNGLERPDWLDPTSELFRRVAASFYQVQTELFGSSTMYKMDLLHEGGKPGAVDVPAASRAVQDALDRAHPGAIWAILGWQKNPLPATLQAIDRSRMFIVDGITEEPGITDREKDFYGTEYAFGTIWNFGGRLNLGAGLPNWNQKFHQLRTKPGSKLNGIALMPEGIDNNPAAVAFFADLPWQDGPVDLPTWFTSYATARYGAADPHAIAAWQIIGKTAYSWPTGKNTRNVTGLVDNQPGLAITGTALQYDIATFDQALAELLQVDPSLRSSGAYRYDLVDVARQVLANHSRLLLPKIRAAYAARDLAEFERLSGQWMSRIKLMDAVLGSDEHFLFGRWQADAARQAATPAEDVTLQYNLKSLVTHWVPGSPWLQDYARREWNGLVGGYYANRWQLYFDSLEAALRTGTTPQKIDWAAVAEQWSRADTKYAAEPTGDYYALASQVLDQPNGDFTIGVERKGVKPGGTALITTTFTNRNALRSTGRVTAQLVAPAGYQVEPTTPATVDQVAPGATHVTGWRVTVPATTAPGSLPSLTATVDWKAGEASDRLSATSALLVGGGLNPQYKTYANVPVEYAQAGNVVGIAAGGEDLWKETAEFASAYQVDALSNGKAVSTRVLGQDGASPYSRAGLMIANDLSRGSGGAGNLAVTPDHGCMLSWDSDGNGQLDSFREVGGFTAPVYLRLAKEGNRFTGSCSGDGKNWSVVGTATVPSVTPTVDTGLFVSAVNRVTKQETIATFTGITPAANTSRDGSADPVQSLGKPVTALSSEAGRPPEAANDGNRANSPYWGGPLELGDTWWQVDLGASYKVSRVNVRNYVDRTRYYTYRLEGSLDGKTWFTLGGRSGPRLAEDVGDTAMTTALARYVRVVGIGNTANGTFHLTEVSVYGIRAS